MSYVNLNINLSKIEYNIIGICSHQPVYKICWILNNTLNDNLIKGENIILDPQKYNSIHSYYFHGNEEEEPFLILVENYGTSLRLIPEEKADFIFMIYKNYYNISKLLTKLNSLKEIIIAYEIDFNKLKSKENLTYIL